MTPRTSYDIDHDDRLQNIEEWRVDTASQLAANTVMVSALSDRLSEGFARLNQAMTTGFSEIGQSVQRLRDEVRALQVTTAEDRSQIQRWRSVIRWGAGVAATVAAAALLAGLHLHR